MTCIKTGTWVYFVAHGFLARCDVYEVGDTHIFRWNINIVQDDYRSIDKVPDGTWIVDNRFDIYCWHRKDLGVTVVHPAAIIKHGERC